MIVGSGLSDSLVQELADKRASFNGLNVTIARMDQIDPTPDNTATPDTMRNFIKVIYDSKSAAHAADSLLSYVLLIGDAVAPDTTVVVIPSYYGFDGGDNFQATDSYYSLLSEEGAADDLFPDVFLGRLPVDPYSRTSPPDPDWELRNVISKILNYDQDGFQNRKILLASGGDPTGLPIFQPYFGYVMDRLPAYVEADTLNRLDYPADSDPIDGPWDVEFSRRLADSLNTDQYWIFGYFDHGNPYYLVQSFFALHYDTLHTPESLPLVLCLGSDTGRFDMPSHNAHGYICFHPSNPGGPAGIAPCAECDTCDVIMERLVLQESGAIGAISMSRSTGQEDGALVFTSYFQALFEDNAFTLGEILEATRFHIFPAEPGDGVNTAMRNLTLFGDPALNIMWENGISAQDTVDLSISASEIQPLGALKGKYLSGSSVELAVGIRNKRTNDADNVDYEVWKGNPGNGTLVGTGTVNNVPGFDGIGWDTLTVNGLTNGTNQLFVVVDTTTFPEPTFKNNIAGRAVFAYAYTEGYPVDIGERATHSVAIADLREDIAGDEILINTASSLRCYSAIGQSVWQLQSQHNGTISDVLNGTPVVGNVFKNGTHYTLFLDSLLYVVDGHGAAVDTISGVSDFFFAGSASAPHAQVFTLADLVQDDGTLEIVTVGAKQGDFEHKYLRAYSLSGPSGTLLWEKQLGSGLAAFDTGSLAVGDVDGDGRSEVLARTNAVGETSDTLYCIGWNGALRWRTEAGTVTNPRANHDICLVATVSGDLGQMDALTSATALSGQGQTQTADVYRISPSGTKELLVSATSEGLTAPEPVLTCGDFDGDQDPEIFLGYRATRHTASIAEYTLGGVLEAEVTYLGKILIRPLLVDISGDDVPELIVVHGGDNDFSENESAQSIDVLDSDLTSIAHFDFPYKDDANSGPYEERAFSGPAIGDVDDDGVAEMAFVSLDSVLHVIEVGSLGKNSQWSSRYGNLMQTNNLEQPLVGEYVQPVSLFNRVRVLGDASFSGSVYIDDTAEFTVSNGDSTHSGRDSTRCEIDFNGAVRIIGSEASPVVFQPETPQGGATDPWWGISISSESQSNLIKHCVIEDAETGLTLSDWPYTYGYVSNVDILDSWIGLRSTIPFGALEDVTATRCGIGFSSASGNQTYRNITAVDCGRGLDHSVGSATVDSSTFADCDTSIVTWDALTLKNSEVRNSQLYGVWAKGGDFHMAHTIVKDKTGSPTPTAVKIDSTVATAVIDTCQISDAGTGVLAKTQTDFTGCRIDNCTTGLSAPWTPQMTLNRCTISFNQTGISASGPIKLNFSRVTRSGTGTGAIAISAPTAEIRSSYLDATLAAVSIDSGLIYTDTLNSDGYGLVMAGPVTCRQSRILSVGSNFYGINASDAASDLVLRGTLVSGYDIGVYLGQGAVADIDSGCTFSGNDAGIHAYASSDVGIRSSTFDANTTNGVSLNVSYAVIEGNTITGSTNGIFFYASDGAVQDRNVIEENGSGVKCDEESAPTIHENKISSNSVGITALNDANPDVGICCDEEGIECDTTGACTGEGRNNISGNTNHHVVNLSPSVTISAECNYWGSRGPLPSKFSGAVDYNPYLGENPLPDLVVAGPPGSMPNTVDALPTNFDVGQNYPNPFNPVTTIRYQVPRPGGSVRLMIYDVRGGVVRTLVNQAKEPGYYTLNWDGRNDRGVNVASGVYFLRMTAPGFAKTQKLVVVK